MAEAQDISTPALDTANISMDSIQHKESPKASTIELIQNLEAKVSAALDALDKDDADTLAGFAQLSDKIESLKRSFEH